MHKHHWSHHFMHHYYLHLVIIVCLIGVISFGAVGLFYETRQRENDLQRVLDLRKIQASLEVFYNDYGTYPSAVGHSKNNRGNTIPGLRYERQQEMFPKISTKDDVSVLSTLIYGGYLDELPVDPNHASGSHFVYAYYVANESNPSGGIVNQYYQLTSKFASKTQRETRARESFDGGNDKDEDGKDLFEVGNGVSKILVNQNEWDLMISRGDVDLNTARRTFTPSALAKAAEGKKVEPNSVQGMYW